MTNNNQPLIQIEEMTKTYQMGDVQVHALRGVSFEVHQGEYVAIMGSSGSGKSTLMNMIGLLDRPTSGSYKIRGTESSQLSKNELADLRNREIGFVFQRFNLLARITARRQVELPLFYAGVPSRKGRQMATEALERVGLGDRIMHKPDELSGGQQQRVAIARALANDPPILVADEPTGNLDSVTADSIFKLFTELVDNGKTILMVTHDMDLAQRASRTVVLVDGEIYKGRRTKSGLQAVLSNQSQPADTPEAGHA